MALQDPDFLGPGWFDKRTPPISNGWFDNTLVETAPPPPPTVSVAALAPASHVISPFGPQ